MAIPKLKTNPITGQVEGYEYPEPSTSTYNWRTNSYSPTVARPNPIFDQNIGNPPAYSGPTTDFDGIFKSAYETLGQPTEEFEKHGRPVAAEAIAGFSKIFIDAYHKKFGEVPTEDKVNDFLSRNLTVGNAAKIITGSLPSNTIDLNTRQYLSDYADEVTPGTQQGGLDANLKKLQDQTAALYGEQRGALTDEANRVFGVQKENLVNDLAAQNILRSPVSRYSLNDLEANKQRSLTQGLAGLAGQQAQGNVNLEDTLARLRQQGQQFGQDLGLRRQAFQNAMDQQTYQQGLDRQQLSLASRLGQLQAAGSKNRLGNALSGAGTGALAGSALGPLGAAGGALVGGIGGYFI